MAASRSGCGASPAPAVQTGTPPPRFTPGSAPRGRDLLGRIAKGAEHPVVDAGAPGLVAEERVYVFPDDLLGRGHLEDPAVAALADQRVAVGEALRARD